MTIAATVQQYLDEHAVNYKLITHPHTGSSHETADASHVPEDHIAKAVIVKDASGYAMIIVPASHWVDTKHLRQALDRELHLATEDELAKLFPDCKPGAIPPLGPAYQLDTYLDEALTTLANVYCEAGDHEQLLHLSGDDLKKLLSGVRQGHYSHSN